MYAQRYRQGSLLSCFCDWKKRIESIDCHRSGLTDNKGIFFGTFLGLNNEYEEISFQIFCRLC